ncbi:hypothetical protein K402DRAFT_202438 [Aulographum hederae CBS 113979]|uniref:Uncharacterized protein n=1 Tax=Aulographum hederae CBS 113979 TaxID=1176131 RepID=A0A6G1HBV6_9PEZI|nr:hypothetical protein K402DRAFT_202438 [Aulographum hederae CBS 113979]
MSGQPCDFALVSAWNRRGLIVASTRVITTLGPEPRLLAQPWIPIATERPRVASRPNFRKLFRPAMDIQAALRSDMFEAVQGEDKASCQSRHKKVGRHKYPSLSHTSIRFQFPFHYHLLAVCSFSGVKVPLFFLLFVVVAFHHRQPPPPAIRVSTPHL